jgi:hypothetical protein
MAVYVCRDGRMVDKATGEPMNRGPHEGPFPCPRVVSDIEPYLSPVSGEVIGGNRQKRADLDRHNCIDTAELPRREGWGTFKNKKFAAKHGMTHRLAEDAK